MNEEQNPICSEAARRWTVCVASVLVLVVPLPSSAKSKRHHETGSGWDTRLSIEEAHTDNVRSAQDGPKKEGAFFTTVKGHASWLPGRSRWASREDRWMPSEFGMTIRGRVFSDFSNRNTVEIKPNLRYDLWRGSVGIRYGYTPRRLRLEDLEGGDDVFYSQHRLGVQYESKFGPKKAFKVAAGAATDWDNYRSSARERDAFRVSGWGELRYRIHNYFSPRVKVKYGQRDTRGANFDREELTILTGFDSRLPMGVDFRFRYQYQNRDYTVPTPTGLLGRNTNFKRDDDINQIEVRLGVAIPWIKGLTTDLRFKLRDGDSTRTSRIFQVREFGVGLSYALPN